MSGGHLVGAFLEMMSAERGAAKNTIEAYRRDNSLDKVLVRVDISPEHQKLLRKLAFPEAQEGEA